MQQLCDHFYSNHGELPPHGTEGQNIQCNAVNVYNYGFK